MIRLVDLKLVFGRRLVCRLLQAKLIVPRSRVCRSKNKRPAKEGRRNESLIRETFAGRNPRTGWDS